MIATAFGVHAVKLVEQGKLGRMVAWSNRAVIDVARHLPPLRAAITRKLVDAAA